MDSLRLVLWGGFFVLLWLGVNQWNLDYVAPPTNPGMASAQTEGPTTQNNKGAEEPSGVLGLSDNLPTVTIEGRPTETPEKPRIASRLVTVKTDVLELGINPDKGGDIVQAKLLKYFPSKKETATPVELLSYNEESYQYFQTGLLSLNNLPEPNHQQAFVEKYKKLELIHMEIKI